jgi:hypothetical protein
VGKEYCRARQSGDDNVAQCEAKRTHAEYVILIDFPLLQWLLEQVSVLRYMYIACLIFNYLSNRNLTMTQKVSQRPSPLVFALK